MGVKGVNFLILLSVIVFPYTLQAQQVEKWKRFEVSYSNPSFSGNPFDLEFYGMFTHQGSGSILKQLGFYAGNNVWKIYFMPDKLGSWSFQTVSSDSDLNNKSGSFQCVASTLPGRLMPVGRRWKLEDAGTYDAPIMIPTRQWFKRTPTDQGIFDFIVWAKDTVGARVIGTTLVYFGHGQDEVPYIKGQEGEEFNIPMWDRLNDHYDVIRDSGMGHYIMFFSDDNESPNRYGITANSQEELRLFRYAIARFSPYPIVIWDTGIDISETRNNSWIDWFADWFNENDAWKHPVGSRSGGGSGGKNPKNATYYSDGYNSLPDHSQFVNTWNSRSKPTAFTDRWREYYYRPSQNYWTPTRLRRAVWEIGLVGGSAVYVSGNSNSGYLDSDYATDLESAPHFGYAALFFRTEIKDFGNLSPHDELVETGNAVLSAQPGLEYVAYLPSGGSVRLNLSHASGTLTASWTNPRNGQVTVISSVKGGGGHTFVAPSSNDWVLHVVSENVDTQPPSPPLGLRIVR